MSLRTEFPKIAHLEAAIFDLDGTLVHSEHVWEAAKVEVVGRYGVQPTKAQLDANVGRGLRDFLDDVFEFSLSADEKRSMGNQIGAVADELLPQLREPVPGASQMLQNLHDRGLKIAICSSSPRRHIVGAIDMLDISRCVEVVVSGSELPIGKPDPLPYVQTLSELAIHSDNACAFEDSVPGITSAMSAGLMVFAIGPGCTGPEFSQCAFSSESFDNAVFNGLALRA